MLGPRRVSACSDAPGSTRDVKLNDAVWGALLVLLAAAVLVHVQSFGTIPGQQVRPGDLSRASSPAASRSAPCC